METGIPYVELSPELQKIVGEPKPATRFFQAMGTDEECRKWTDALFSRFRRGLVSPGGAGRYAGVSRAAVNKALREGRLTGFSFYVSNKPHSRSFFGLFESRISPYIYVPVVECRAWHQLLKLRVDKAAAELQADAMKRFAAELQTELEGAKPDYEAPWMDQPPKPKRKRK